MLKTNKKNLKGLYAITDPSLMGDELIAMAEQTILGGTKILQYRNKSAPIKQQEQEALSLCKLCNHHDVIFIVNDNIDLAIKVNADGVHLGQKDTQLQEARKRLCENKIIGVTCNNQIKFAETAQEQGADYVAFGRFFNSQTKPSAPHAELSLLTQARKKITVPIVAIGGITPESVPLLLNEGVDMLAVIQGIFGQTDILKATRQFVEIIDSPRTSV